MRVFPERLHWEGKTQLESEGHHPMGWGPGLDKGGGGKPDGAWVVSSLISCFVSKQLVLLFTATSHSHPYLPWWSVSLWARKKKILSPIGCFFQVFGHWDEKSTHPSQSPPEYNISTGIRTTLLALGAGVGEGFRMQTSQTLNIALK